MICHLPVIEKVLPRFTCLEPYATVTATRGVMLGIKVGTTPYCVNLWTTRAEDCAEMPTGEQEVARLSVSVGAANATDAARKNENREEICIVNVFRS